MTATFVPTSLRDTVDALASGRITPRHLAQHTLDRITELDPGIHAWVHVCADDVLASAERQERVGPRGPLYGIPVGVKDIIDVAGMPTRCGSELRGSRRATRDADCVALARRLGAIPVGKTVTTEFGYFKPGPTRNPHALGHTPGGSSSGSAAAVAAGMVPLAFGTQTAGSLTRPAAFCGVAGLVTSRGQFSTAGITGLSPSLDALGLLTRTVADLHYAWTTLRTGALPKPLAPRRPSRLRLWSGNELGDVSPEMTSALQAGAEAATAAGTVRHELDFASEIIELTEHHATVMAYEAARERATEAAQLDRISAPLTELFHAGKHTPDDKYHAAVGEIQTTRRRLLAMLDEGEFIFGPAALGPAPDGLASTGSPVMSRPWQAMGLPVVTIPGHKDRDGLPLGLQLIGRPGTEEQLFHAAAWLESRS
jgi:Asp-tRNA(Asn)/Glu-tRNA(Gln) amidotransferase A subunit family amidase